MNTRSRQIPSHKSYFYSNFLVPSLDHFHLLRKQALFYIRTRTSLFCIRPRTSLILGENHSPDHSCSGGTSEEPTCNAGDTGDLGSIPGTGRSPGGGCINSLQYSCLGNPINRGTWQLQSMWLQRFGHHWSNLALTHVVGNRFFFFLSVYLPQLTLKCHFPFIWNLQHSSYLCLLQG